MVEPALALDGILFRRSGDIVVAGRAYDGHSVIRSKVYKCPTRGRKGRRAAEAHGYLVAEAVARDLDGIGDQPRAELRGFEGRNGGAGARGLKDDIVDVVFGGA